MNEENQKLLGDAIADVMEKTGVTKLTEKATKAVGIKDCGCKKRQDQLNALHAKVKGKLAGV